MADLTVRPVGARIVAYGVVVVVVVMTVVIGAALPEEITFSISELVTLALVLLGTFALLHGVGRSKVVADDVGVHVRNGFRDHDVSWSDVEGVSFKQGAPWATLVTTEDERLMLFAIQGSDGRASHDAVADLRRRVEQHR